MKRSQNMDQSEPVINLLDLPFEILCHILSYLSQDDIFWNVGFTCQTLFRASLENVQFIQVSLYLKYDRSLNCLYNTTL